MSNLKFNIKRRNQAFDMVIISNLYDAYSDFDCLIDTGARVPVWCAGESLLKTYYPKCVKQNEIFILNGFGTGFEVADVYLIPDFKLFDGKQKIHYLNMLVAVTDRDYTFNLILSYNMFNKMNISINTFTNKGTTHNIEPTVRIISSKDIYYVGCKKANVPSNYRDRIISKYGNTNILDSIYINQQNLEVL